MRLPLVLPLALVLLAWGTLGVEMLQDSEAAELVLNLDDTGRGRGRGRGRSRRFGASGRFALGRASNRAGNDEEEELGESVDHSVGVPGAVCDKAGKCTIDLKDLQHVFKVGWSKGFNAANGRASEEDIPSNETHWGCGPDALYFNEWLIRDSHGGCFHTADMDLRHITENRVTVSPGSENQMFWDHNCGRIRWTASYPLFKNGFCKRTGRGGNTTYFDVDNLGIWTTCGVYTHNWKRGPSWYRSISYLHDPTVQKKGAVGSKEFLQQSNDHLAGKCVARKDFVTTGTVHSPTIPGLCLDKAGNCACYDGQVTVTTIGVGQVYRFYHVFAQFVEIAQRLSQLFCYDAPSFKCVFDPALFNIKGRALVDLKTKCHKNFGTKPSTKPLLTLGEGVEAGQKEEQSHRLKGKQRWGMIKKLAKKAKSVVKKAKSAAKQGVVKKIVSKYVPSVFQPLALKVIAKGRVELKDVQDLLNSEAFRRFVVGKLKSFAHKAGFYSFDVLMDKWAKKKITGSALYEWAFGADFQREWRYPWKGILSKVLNSTLSLADTRQDGANSLRNAGNSLCRTVSKWSTQGAHLPYEDRPVVLFATDVKAAIRKSEAKTLPPEERRTEVYIIKAKPKFWRRAASRMVLPTGKTPSLKEGKPLCWSANYQGKPTNLFKPLNLPDGRNIVWGCPNAVPIGPPGKFTFVASGTGEDMTKHHADEAPVLKKGETICSEEDGSCSQIGLMCVHKLSYGIGQCDTCCCKEGLISSNLESTLEFGDKSDCGGFFSASDMGFRAFASLMRVEVLDQANDICMEKTNVDRTNTEVCQRFKCKPKESTMVAPIPDKTLAALCGDFTCAE